MIHSTYEPCYVIQSELKELFLRYQQLRCAYNLLRC